MVCGLNVQQEGGGEPPKGALGGAIDTHFGSLEGLVKKMSAEGAALQGSGWVVSTHIVGFVAIVIVMVIDLVCFVFD